MLGINRLKKEVAALQATVNTLTKDITKAHQQMEEMLVLTKAATSSQSVWYENEELLRTMDPEVKVMAYSIQGNKKAEIADLYPALKKRVIFHGACLGCTTPINYGLGTCRGCKFIGAEWDKPDLSSKDPISN